MKCKNFHKKMIFYIDGELTAPENSVIDQHLKTCNDCSLLFSELKSCYKLIENKETLKPNPFLYTRIKQNIENIEQALSLKELKPVYMRIIQPVLIACLLVTGISFGILLGNSYDNTPQKNKSIASTNEFYMNDFQSEELEINLLNE